MEMPSDGKEWYDEGFNGSDIWFARCDLFSLAVDFCEVTKTELQLRNIDGIISSRVVGN
jgi:hypothetical protein